MNVTSRYVSVGRSVLRLIIGVAYIGYKGVFGTNGGFSAFISAAIALIVDMGCEYT